MKSYDENTPRISQFTMKSGTATIAGYVDVNLVDIQGGAIGLTGNTGTWGSAAYLGGYDGLTVSGGTITMNNNSLMFIGRNNSGGASLVLSGGDIKMQGTAADHTAAHIWAGSPNLAISPSYNPNGPKYSPNTMTISGTANIQVSDGGAFATTKYGIINSQNTTMSGGTISVHNGLLRIQANPKTDAALWADSSNIADREAAGAWNMTGGTLNLSHDGVLQSLLKDFTISGGTVTLDDGHIDNEFLTVTGGTVAISGTKANWDASAYLGGYGGLNIGGNAVITMNEHSELFTGQTTIDSITQKFGTLSIGGNAVINMNGTGDSAATAHIWAGNNAANKLSINGGTINVGANKTGLITSANAVMSGGAINVANDGKLYLQTKPAVKGAATILDNTATGTWAMSGGNFAVNGNGQVDANRLASFTVSGGTLGVSHLALGTSATADAVDTTSDFLTKTMIVSGGTVNLTTLNVANGGAGTETLKISGGAVNVADTVQNSANGIALSGGTLTVELAKVANGTALLSGVGQINASGTGVVNILNGGSMTATDAKTLHDNLVGAGGLWNGILVTDVTETSTKLADGSTATTVTAADAAAMGTDQLKGATVATTQANGAATLGAAAGVVALTPDTGTATTAVTLTTAASSTIVGNGTNLVIGAGDKQTNVVLADGGTLTLGVASTVGGGTLNGAITNTSGQASTINVANGAFAVTGIDLTTGSGNGALNVQENANLRVTGAVKAESLNMNGGALNSSELALGNSTAVTASSSSIVGSIVQTDTLTATGAGTVLNIGSTTGSKGVLVAGTSDLKGASVFLDPAWNGSTEMKNASQMAVGGNSVTGLYTVGQNAWVTMGATDLNWLPTAVKSSGLLWGENNITAALGIFAPQTLSKDTGGVMINGALTALGTTGGTNKANANQADFKANSLLVVNAGNLGSSAALTGTGTGTASVADSAKLLIANGTVGNTYTILSGFTGVDRGTTQTGWTGNNLVSSSYLQNLTMDSATQGTIKVAVTNNSAASVLPGISTGMAGMVDSLNAQSLNNTDSANAGIQFVSRATDKRFIDAPGSARALESVAQVALAGGSPSVSLDAVSSSTGAMGERTSVTMPAFSRSAGISSGDAGHAFGLWAMPLYRSSEIDGQKSGAFKYGVDSDLWGGIIGADVTNPLLGGDLRFGFAMNVGSGDSKSSGSLYKTKNDFDFWGASVYAGYRLNGFGLSADLGYTSTSSDIKQNLAPSLDMGSQATSKVDADTYSLGLKAEYVFATPYVDITPSIGARYMGYRQGQHNVNSNAGTIFNMDKAEMNTWTFPIGVKFSRDLDLSGWTVSPELNLAVIPAAGDLKLDSKARIPGVNVSAATLSGHVYDDVTGEAGLGLRVARDNVSFGLNYDFQGSENRNAHSVFGSLRVSF